MLQSIDRRREHRDEISPSMREAHKKAESLLADPGYSISEREFVGVYGESAVNADTDKTSQLALHFQQGQSQRVKNAKIIAEVLEAIILEQAELSEWLGGAHTLKAARYDDFINKTDMVAEWYSPEDGSRILALAVDVTFGVTTVADKLEMIKNEIDSGALGSIRYFKDARGDFMGTRNNVPRVVIGVRQETVEELAALWVRGDKKALGSHPIQRLLVAEIVEQLQYMHAYAKRRGNQRVADAYAPSLNIMRALEAKKRAIPLGTLKDDTVADAIRWQARRFFGE